MFPQAVLQQQSDAVFTVNTSNLLNDMKKEKPEATKGKKFLL